MAEVTELPFHEWFDESGTTPNKNWDGSEVLEETDAVLAHDIMNEAETMMYGREFLDSLTNCGQETPWEWRKVSKGERDEWRKCSSGTGFIR